jgi:hypothetical protein
LTCFGLGVLTAFRPFAIIGESRRNFEYTIFPVSVLLPLILIYSQFLFGVIFIVTFASVFCFLIKLKPYSWEKNKPTFLKYAKKALGFIRKRKEEAVFCIPTGLSYAVAHFCGKKVLYFESYACKPFFDKRIISFKDILPPQSLIKKYLKKYRISLVLTHKIRLPFGRKIFENNEYRIYKVSLKSL